MSKVIMGIQILRRSKVAPSVQSLLTEYGCYIRTRLGLHEAASDDCSNKGLILLELIDEPAARRTSLKKDCLRLAT
jgi:hypothetical protein